MSQRSTEPIIGGLPPPPDVIPNFEDPYSIAPVLHGFTILLLVLSTFTTIIRMYTRFQIMKDHGWEDYIMFVAWLGFLAYCAVGYPALKYGAGVHQWNVPATTHAYFPGLFRLGLAHVVYSQIRNLSNILGWYLSSNR